MDQAKAILELFHHVDVTDEVADEIENDLTDDDRDAIIKQKSHRPALNFMQMGFKVGDVLHWKEDPSITITIHSDRRVLYNGTEMAISAVTRELKESKWYVAPGQYWLFKDRLLGEIYDETYHIEEG